MGGLLELAERVEALAGPCRETDARIWCALQGVRYVGHNPAYSAYDNRNNPLTQVEFTEPPKRTRCVSGFNDFQHALPVTASLDAAMTLVPEGWQLRQMNFSAPCADDRKWHLNLHGGCVGQDTFVGRGATPALALTAAALRARAAIAKATA